MGLKLFKMKKTSILLILAIIFGGCSLLNKPKPASPVFNSASLKDLVLRAISGDTSTNKKLKNLVDLNIPVNDNYNSVTIDSLKTKSNKKYFIVLINYPNPIYNRFAIYDSTLNSYLIDKSLNGYINESVIDLNGNELIKVSESFISKDVLQLSRISLYQISDTSASLTFRAFTKLVHSKLIFSQNITEFSAGSIKTEFTSSKASSISGRGDIYLFDTLKKKYISPDSTFDNFVSGYIRNFISYSEKPEITDKKSLYASIGIDIDLDTIKNTANIKDTQGYTLTLTDNWKTFKNISIANFIKTPLKGSKSVNEIIGAYICIIALPEGDSAENFINYTFTNSADGKYKVKYSDKIEMQKDFVQFFEYSCGTKKYLLILSTSKYTYENFKAEFNNIINSFSINC